MIGTVSDDGTLEFEKPVWFDDNTTDDYEKFWIRRDDLNNYCNSLLKSIGQPLSI